MRRAARLSFTARIEGAILRSHQNCFIHPYREQHPCWSCCACRAKLHIIPPRSLALQGWELIDLPLRASNDASSISMTTPSLLVFLYRNGTRAGPTAAVERAHSDRARSGSKGSAWVSFHPFHRGASASEKDGLAAPLSQYRRDLPDVVSAIVGELKRQRRGLGSPGLAVSCLTPALG